MKSRFYMRSKDGRYFINAEYSKEGKMSLMEIRKRYPRLFKHQRIKEILQAVPKEVPLNHLIDRLGEHMTVDLLNIP